MLFPGVPRKIWLHAELHRPGDRSRLREPFWRGDRRSVIRKIAKKRWFSRKITSSLRPTAVHSGAHARPHVERALLPRSTLYRRLGNAPDVI